MTTRSQAAAATLDAFAPATPPARVASRKRGAPEPAGPRLTGPSGLPHDTLRVIIGMLDAASASSLRATCKELKGLTVREGEGVVVGLAVQIGGAPASPPLPSHARAQPAASPPPLTGQRAERGGAGGLPSLPPAVADRGPSLSLTLAHENRRSPSRLNLVGREGDG